MVSIKTVVIDEQELIRIAVGEILSHAADIDFIGGFTDVGELLASKQEVDVLLLGDTLPPANPLASIAQVNEARPETKIIVLCRQWAVPSIKAVLDCGALGVVDKSEALPDLLAVSVRHVFRGKLFLSPEVALAYTNAENGDAVNERELDVIRLMRDGVTTKQIAAALGVKARTVYRIQEKLCKKWNLRTTGQIVPEAIKRGLLRD